MADWSQLPNDLLHLISTHIETATDLLRFRSICTTWRSSTSPNRHRFSNRFPTFPNDGISTTSSLGFHLTKRSIFLLTLPPNPRTQTPPTTTTATNPQPWLVKTSQPNTPHRTQLLNPLSRYRFDPLPPSLPPILDLTRLRIRELGHEFVLHYINECNLYMEKVVAMACDDDFNFLLLTIHVSGKLAVFRSVDKKWSIIQEMASPYDDVMLYRGRLYAVDNTGRTVVVVNFEVDSDLGLDLVAHSVFGGDKKYLVESEGDLLLVDMYLSIEAAGEEEEEGDAVEVEGEEGENGGFCVSERTVRFKVYRLDEGEGKWEEVKSLGDRVVFLGDDCTFSASAREIGSGRGNFVIFTDNWYYLYGEEGWDGGLEGWGGIGVFDLESGCISPLGNFPEFLELIWPPPQWITSTTVEQQNHVEERT